MEFRGCGESHTADVCILYTRYRASVLQKFYTNFLRSSYIYGNAPPFFFFNILIRLKLQIIYIAKIRLFLHAKSEIIPLFYFLPSCQGKPKE